MPIELMASLCASSCFETHTLVRGSWTHKVPSVPPENMRPAEQRSCEKHTEYGCQIYQLVRGRTNCVQMSFALAASLTSASGNRIPRQRPIKDSLVDTPTVDISHTFTDLSSEHVQRKASFHQQMSFNPSS
jgi:hypothetical protein